VVWSNEGKVKVKVQPCTGNEALYTAVRNIGGVEV